MEKFITASKESKNAQQMFLQSSVLPINILIFGDEGVGKKSLAYSVFPDILSFDGKSLEEMLRQKKVDLSKEKVILVHNIDRANNVTQLAQNLQDIGVKIIATADQKRDIFEEVFLIRVDLPPLSQREEDTKELKERFIKEAKELFSLQDVDLECINPNLDKNATSLKESIYRSLLLSSLTKNQMMDTLERFLYDVMQENNEYKDFLEIFEIPLLKASQRRYKSQLQMAQKLNINRNTLRKKLYQYDLAQKGD